MRTQQDALRGEVDMTDLTPEQEYAPAKKSELDITIDIKAKGNGALAVLRALGHIDEHPNQVVSTVMIVGPVTEQK